MNNIKSGLTIAILLGILYGVYTTLSKPDPALPEGMTKADVENLAPPDIDFGEDVETPKSNLAIPSERPEPPDLPPMMGEEPSPAEPSPGDGVRTASRGGNGSLYGDPNTDPPQTSDEPSEAGGGGNQPVDPAPGNPGNEVAPPGNTYGNPSENDVGLKNPHRGPSNPEIVDPGVTPSAYTAPTQDFAKIALHDYKRAMDSAKFAVDDRRFTDALGILSPFHNNQHLPEEQRKELHTWLDALAGIVIYSPEHHLEQAYLVQGTSHTLYDVANQYQVPVQLLQNINAGKVKDPRILVPGTELKVVPGPFRAEVDTKRGELTLFIGKLYAGRFACSINELKVQPGDYIVHNKERDRDFFDVDRTIAGKDPNNPYGGYWIDLGNDVCIHGSPLSLGGNAAPQGCIGLSSHDAADVFGILSKESAVLVR